MQVERVEQGKDWLKWERVSSSRAAPDGVPSGLIPAKELALLLWWAGDLRGSSFLFPSQASQSPHYHHSIQCSPFWCLAGKPLGWAWNLLLWCCCWMASPVTPAPTEIQSRKPSSKRNRRQSRDRVQWRHNTPLPVLGKGLLVARPCKAVDGNSNELEGLPADLGWSRQFHLDWCAHDCSAGSDY